MKERVKKGHCHVWEGGKCYFRDGKLEDCGTIEQQQENNEFCWENPNGIAKLKQINIRIVITESGCVVTKRTGFKVFYIQ